MRIGKTFSAELSSAGLAHVAIVWSEDGDISFGTSVSETDKEAVMAVLASHIPPTKLADIKITKNDEINADRAAANTATFTHDGGVFDADALSRSDIDGVNGYVALYDSLPPAFPGAWKAADNSWYPIADVAAWKAFYASMVATGAANFAHAQELKAHLAAATTPEAVAAIVW